MISGLIQGDSHFIGFVDSCFSVGAITIQEMCDWVYYMIEQCDDLPPYMYYLMDAKCCSSLHEIIGFRTNSGLNSKEIHSLIALSYCRFPEEEWDSNIPKGFAIGALKRNPQVVERFKETFPFIELPDPLIPS